MDNRLLLVKAITLLYRERQIGEEGGSTKLIETLLEKIQVQSNAVTISTEVDTLTGLRDTANYLAKLPPGVPIEKTGLIQRLKLNCKDDDRLFQSFVAGIETDLDEAQTKNAIISLKHFINDAFRELLVQKILSDASSKIKFQRDKIHSIKPFVRELRTALEEFASDSETKDPAIVSSIDISDVTALNAVLEEIKDADKAGMILKTGWQGLNRMLQGGFRRGETWTLAALQHNYKTGFSLSLFLDLATFNTPVLKDPSKKPMMVRISFEDSLSANLQFAVQKIELDRTGQLPDISKFDPATASNIIQQRLGKNGYEIRMVRVNPSLWSHIDIQDYILTLEAQGYEVHVLMVDYLPMISPKDCEQGASGHDYKDMVKRMRNFCSARNMLFMTPWQLSTDAKMLMREGRGDLVKQVVGGGYYALSKQIDQEVDGELFIGIERVNGFAFLAVQRGKHRGMANILSEKEKYMVLPFPENGPIPSDLGKEEITLRRPGGGPIGSAEETPFYEFTG